MKLIYIKWFDSCYELREKTTEEFDDEYTIETVGFLARETKKTISIAGDWIEKDKCWRHIFHIPKVNIIEKKICKGWTW